jgi:hypothetical protein
LIYEFIVVLCTQNDSAAVAAATARPVLPLINALMKNRFSKQQKNREDQQTKPVITIHTFLWLFFLFDIPARKQHNQRPKGLFALLLFEFGWIGIILL